MDHNFLFIAGQGVMEWETDQLIANLFRHRMITLPAAKGLPHIREVQRQVMKYTVNPALPQMRDHFLTKFKGRQKHIEHVIRLLTILWDVWQLHAVRGGPIREACLVYVPDLFAMQLNFLALFKLGEQKGSQKI